MAFQYIFSRKGYCCKRVIPIFAVNTAYKSSKTIMFFATVMKLILIFVRRTAAMCFTISFRFAATLMPCGWKCPGFFGGICYTTAIAYHEKKNDKCLNTSKYLITFTHFILFTVFSFLIASSKFNCHLLP